MYQLTRQFCILFWATELCGIFIVITNQLVGLNTPSNRLSIFYIKRCVLHQIKNSLWKAFHEKKFTICWSTSPCSWPKIEILLNLLNQTSAKFTNHFLISFLFFFFNQISLEDLGGIIPASRTKATRWDRPYHQTKQWEVKNFGNGEGWHTSS